MPGQCRTVRQGPIGLHFSCLKMSCRIRALNGSSSMTSILALELSIFFMIMVLTCPVFGLQMHFVE